MKYVSKPNRRKQADFKKRQKNRAGRVSVNQRVVKMTNENMGAGALGGAAVGAVSALGFTLGGVAGPLIATAVGAVLGAGLVRLASMQLSDDGEIE